MASFFDVVDDLSFCGKLEGCLGELFVKCSGLLRVEEGGFSQGKSFSCERDVLELLAEDGFDSFASGQEHGTCEAWKLEGGFDDAWVFGLHEQDGGAALGGAAEFLVEVGFDVEHGDFRAG